MIGEEIAAARGLIALGTGPTVTAQAPRIEADTRQPVHLAERQGQPSGGAAATLTAGSLVSAFIWWNRST